MKNEGVRVIGSCGSAAKVAVLKDLGIEAFDYRAEDPAEALARLAPGGVDFLFDNTAGAVRTAVLESMKGGGEVLTSGRIARYDAARGPAGGDEAKDAKLIYDKCVNDYGQFFVGHFDASFVACTKDLVSRRRRPWSPRGRGALAAAPFWAAPRPRTSSPCRRGCERGRRVAADADGVAARRRRRCGLSAAG